ncbi:hypothetical protein Tsubulata_027685 [Turnera subulata]|uniref:Anoctamin transmembrane domain-containing protein n=1 Tax=Turnera subulata TaxID=218843 RepID=A0A9Q0F2F8_9ROSI|nr:hypothetical protein Tsubulata_027685 [Turnera subulata]
MNCHGEEHTAFEMCVVVPKRFVKEDDGTSNCVEVLIKESRSAGLIVESVLGFTDEFIKLAAPLETLGRAAAELHMKKPTYIGMDLQFEWEEVKAFTRQPDGSLFSWHERFQCYHHLLYGIVNKSRRDVILEMNGKQFLWLVGESLIQRLESEGIVKQVFPLHDEVDRKELLRSWVLNWRNFTNQPIDDMYSYFGLKIAIYFAFLRMYTRWMLFPAAFGIIVHFVHFGPLQLLVLPTFFIGIILWAVLFFQFWKRKNSSMLARWQINYSVNVNQGYKFLGMEWGTLQSPMELIKSFGTDNAKEKEAYQRYEWFGHLTRFRNNAIAILSIICLQLPFELAYAHLYEVISSDFIKFGLTAIYLVLIQYFTKIGGKISMKLIQYENNENTEHQADSLVYKARTPNLFGLYFMQSYIGVFYHALLHRNFTTLRQLLIQRVVIYQVLENLLGNSLPYLKYSYKKYRAVRSFMNPLPAEKNLADYLALALQFGMIMMFACAFPLAFAFAAVNSFTEIRTDALKLLVMFKRPVPRVAATVGAWLNIFQFLIVMSICTNSALLVWLYDQEGKWKIEPGLAAILVMEHILLLIKFGFSRFVPEEPAWVRANRAKNATQAQDVCSKRLLRSISGGETAFSEMKVG